MREIPLTQGKVVLVDDEDYDFLMRWKWFAWQSTSSCYARRNQRVASTKYRQVTIQMHRVILGDPAGMEIDHIDGNGLNNQKNNLRFCTHRQNSKNRKIRSDNKLGYKGVTKQWNRYYAYIQGELESIYLGSFNSAEEAARAYDKKAKELFGLFAKLNFPNQPAE